MTTTAPLTIYIASSFRNLHGVRLLRDALKGQGHCLMDWTGWAPPVSPDLPEHERKALLDSDDRGRLFELCANACRQSDLVVYYGPAGQDAAAEVGMAFESGTPTVGLLGPGEKPGLVLRRTVAEWFEDTEDLLAMTAKVYPDSGSKALLYDGGSPYLPQERRSNRAPFDPASVSPKHRAVRKKLLREMAEESEVVHSIHGEPCIAGTYILGGKPSSAESLNAGRRPYLPPEILAQGREVRMTPCSSPCKGFVLASEAEPGICVDAQFERLKDLVKNRRSDLALSYSLGVPHSLISDSRRRGFIHSDIVSAASARFGVNPEYILTGAGKPFLPGADARR